MYIYILDSWARNFNFSCPSVKLGLFNISRNEDVRLSFLSSFLLAMPFNNSVVAISSFPQVQLRDQVVNNACANSDRSFTLYIRRQMLYEWFVLYILCIPFQMESIINFCFRLAEISRRVDVYNMCNNIFYLFYVREATYEKVKETCFDVDGHAGRAELMCQNQSRFAFTT